MKADPFDILGLPPSFELAPDQIRRAALARTARIHPDVSGSEATELAAINQARGLLDNPEQRAAALLSRLGGATKEQDRSLPSGFLEHMMMIQEEIEAATTPEARATWVHWAEQERAKHVSRVGEQFRQHAASPAPSDLLQAIRRELNAWRYIERLIEQLQRDERS